LNTRTSLAIISTAPATTPTMTSIEFNLGVFLYCSAEYCSTGKKLSVGVISPYMDQVGLIQERIGSQSVNYIQGYWFLSECSFC
ncbi:hypothetical protein SOVF_200750, partial [Spinacia oleracea]